MSVDPHHTPPTWPIGDYRLRPLRLTDAAAWFAYLSDPRVIEHTSFPELDLYAVNDMLSRHINDYATATSCRWALADSVDKLAGTCGFSNWSLPHSHAELVYDLHPDFWGRGLMRAATTRVLTWAFDSAGFNRVHAFVMTSNRPSIKLLESLAFVREGTVSRFRIARGVPRDFHICARLRT